MRLTVKVNLNELTSSIMYAQQSCHPDKVNPVFIDGQPLFVLYIIGLKVQFFYAASQQNSNKFGFVFDLHYLCIKFIIKVKYNGKNNIDG